MEEVYIRQAALNDVAALLIFEQGVIVAERPFDSTLKSGSIHYYDIQQMIASPDVELLVAVYENKIVGSGYARIENAKNYLQHAQHAYLGFMYVLPEYRGKGINKKIIAALSAWSVSKNIFELRLDVYYYNTAAIKAYEKAGFTPHMVEMRMKLMEDK